MSLLNMVLIALSWLKRSVTLRMLRVSSAIHTLQLMTSVSGNCNSCLCGAVAYVIRVSSARVLRLCHNNSDELQLIHLLLVMLYNLSFFGTYCYYWLAVTRSLASVCASLIPALYCAVP